MKIRSIKYEISSIDSFIMFASVGQSGDVLIEYHAKDKDIMPQVRSIPLPKAMVDAIRDFLNSPESRPQEPEEKVFA